MVLSSKDSWLEGLAVGRSGQEVVVSWSCSAFGWDHPEESMTQLKSWDRQEGGTAATPSQLGSESSCRRFPVCYKPECSNCLGLYTCRVCLLGQSKACSWWCSQRQDSMGLVSLWGVWFLSHLQWKPRNNFKKKKQWEQSCILNLFCSIERKTECRAIREELLVKPLWKHEHRA